MPTHNGLAEEIMCLTESCMPVILLQHGRKAPIKGPDGSWLVVTDPDDVVPAIEKVSHRYLPNLGAVGAGEYFDNSRVRHNRLTFSSDQREFLLDRLASAA